MYSPALAILGQVAWRFRWGHAAALFYFLIAIALSGLLPANLRVFPGSNLGGDEGLPAVGYWLGMPTLLVIVYAISIFTNAGPSVESGFGTHLFVLPMRTTTLVAWLMGAGCLIVAAVWLVAASLIFRRGGIDAPLWWPAAIAAVQLAWFQASAWTPFAQRWLQVAFTALVITIPTTVLLVGTLIAREFGISELACTLLILCLLPPSYFAALAGVAQARRGDAYDWKLWSRWVAWLAARRGPVTRPFASAAWAQLWFECRAHGWTLPVFAGSLQFCFLIAMCIAPGDVALSWKILAVLLAAPVFVAMMAGAALGAMHDPSSKPSTASFVLTRPVSTSSLIRSKFVTAAVGAGATWVLVLAIMPVLLLRPGFLASIREVAGSVPLWKSIGLPLFVISFLIALTWKSIVANLWVSLTGRGWVADAVGFAFTALLFCGGGAGLWLYFHPQHQPAALAAVPWIVGSLLVLKALVAIAVVRLLQRSQFMSMPRMAAIVGLWSLVVLGLLGIAYGLTPGDFWSAGDALAGISLYVPFSRLIGAPLALQWNRHR